MRKTVAFLFSLLLIMGCNSKNQNEKLDPNDYLVFGDTISLEKSLSRRQMLEKYKSLKEGDTIQVKFRSIISSVCQKKGCWMRLDLPNNNKSFVKFKDYAFFVPINAANSEVIVDGKAFLRVESVAELKHYAKDAGKPQTYIDAISKPEVTYSFEANGVLLKKNKK